VAGGSSANRSGRAFHRGERGPVDDDPSHTRVAGDGGKLGVLDFADLEAGADAAPGAAASEDADVRVVPELDNHP
jgi:hypothetical protein